MKLKNNLTFKHTLDMLETQYDYKYDLEQKYQLEVGFECDVDIHKYANPDFDWIYMSHLRRALEHGSDISLYANPAFNSNQMFQIMYGLETTLMRANTYSLNTITS